MGPSRHSRGTNANQPQATHQPPHQHPRSTTHQRSRPKTAPDAHAARPADDQATASQAATHDQPYDPSLLAGENAVWLQSSVNDIRAVANTDFLDDNPDIRRLLEVVAIPLSDIAAQNANMAAGNYTEADIEADADAWIAANRDKVDSWMATARG